MEPRVVDFDQTSRGWFKLLFGEDYFRYSLGQPVEKGDARVIWEQSPRLMPPLDALPNKMVVEWVVDRTTRGVTTVGWHGKHEYEKSLTYEHREATENYRGYLIQTCEIREQKSATDTSHYQQGFIIRWKKAETDGPTEEKRYQETTFDPAWIESIKQQIEAL